MSKKALSQSGGVEESVEEVGGIVGVRTVRKRVAVVARVGKVPPDLYALSPTDPLI